MLQGLRSPNLVRDRGTQLCLAQGEIRRQPQPPLSQFGVFYRVQGKCLCNRVPSSWGCAGGDIILPGMSSSTYRSAIPCVLGAGLLLPGAALPSSKHAVVLGSGTITICHWGRVQHGKKKFKKKSLWLEKLSLSKM